MTRSLCCLRIALLGILGLALLSRSPEAAAQDPAVLDAYPNLDFDKITDIQSAGDGSGRIFVVEQEGTIEVFSNNGSVTETETFLNLSSQVTCCGERGLLGLAFHPDYSNNGRVFVNYTTTVFDQLVSRISKFVASPETGDVDRRSETVLLQVAQAFTNHNAGQLQFGPDGYLYAGLGDGGGSGDPLENGQDPTTLLGTMMRLNVDGGGMPPDCGGPDAGYTIPADNPFVDDDSTCNEIFAYGFRNPFRFSFGPEERLWVADVGQDRREEIDWVEAGGNYGWNTMEGSLCFDPNSGCDRTGLELPVWEYDHEVGRSVTGGYVVTEGGCSYIQGDYVFADFVSGRIWRLQPDQLSSESENPSFQESDLLLDTGFQISTFGVAPDGTILISSYGDAAPIYRFNCSTLPVELVSLDASQVRQHAVELTWQVASEQTNAGFEVQQKSERRTWAKVGFVESAAQDGTTTERNTYRFVAKNLKVGTHHFRLRQVDLDGSSTLTEPTTVNIAMTQALRITAPSPNPARETATLSFAVQERAPARITLYNMLGQRERTLYEGTPLAGESQRIRIETSVLASGTYIIRLEAGGKTASRRLTVVR